MRNPVLLLGLLALVAVLVPAVPAPAKDAPLKAGSVHHLASRKHAHPYSLYAPSQYSPKASWPLVISSHGLNGSGKGEIGQWTGLAREFGFIVACPDMCTATRGRPTTSQLEPAVEDEEVILSIMEEVAEHFRVNPRAVMITGFSGGGNPSYWTGLRHPDLITHICTRGGNFAIQQIPREEALLEAGRKRTQIYIYYGEADHELILGTGENPGQARQAHDALTKAGYEHVKIEMIPGMKHESRARIAAEWFAAYLADNAKMFAAGDKADEMLEEIRAAIGEEDWRDAVRGLTKLMGHEEKTGLPPVSPAPRAAIEKVAAEMIAQATKAKEAGDLSEALKVLGKVSRDFRGLPAADEAKELTKEWKE